MSDSKVPKFDVDKLLASIKDRFDTFDEAKVNGLVDRRLVHFGAIAGVTNLLFLLGAGLYIYFELPKTAASFAVADYESRLNATKSLLEGQVKGALDEVRELQKKGVTLDIDISAVRDKLAKLTTSTEEEVATLRSSTNRIKSELDKLATDSDSLKTSIAKVRNADVEKVASLLTALEKHADAVAIQQSLADVTRLVADAKASIVDLSKAVENVASTDRTFEKIKADTITVRSLRVSAGDEKVGVKIGVAASDGHGIISLHDRNNVRRVALTADSPGLTLFDVSERQRRTDYLQEDGTPATQFTQSDGTTPLLYLGKTGKDGLRLSLHDAKGVLRYAFGVQTDGTPASWMTNESGTDRMILDSVNKDGTVTRREK